MGSTFGLNVVAGFSPRSKYEELDGCDHASHDERQGAHGGGIPGANGEGGLSVGADHPHRFAAQHYYREATCLRRGRQWNVPGAPISGDSPWRGCFQLGNIVPSVFTPVLAKHSKNFSIVDSLAIGVDRIQRNFDPLRQHVDTWRSSQITDAEAKLVIYRALIENQLDMWDRI